MATLNEVYEDMANAKKAIDENNNKEDGMTIADRAAAKLERLINGMKAHSHGATLKAISITEIYEGVKGIRLFAKDTVIIWLRSDGELIESPVVPKNNSDLKVVSVQHIADTYGAEKAIDSIVAAVKKIRNDQEEKYKSNLNVAKMNI